MMGVHWFAHAGDLLKDSVRGEKFCNISVLHVISPVNGGGVVGVKNDWVVRW